MSYWLMRTCHLTMLLICACNQGPRISKFYSQSYNRKRTSVHMLKIATLSLKIELIKQNNIFQIWGGVDLFAKP